MQFFYCRSTDIVVEFLFTIYDAYCKNGFDSFSDQNEVKFCRFLIVSFA